MASFAQSRINAGLDARVDGDLFLSAHTAFSTDGANELSGGAPAYARQTITMGDAGSGLVSNTSSESLNVPPATTVAYVGLFDAVTAGNFVGMFPLGSNSTRVGSCISTSEASAARDTFFVANHGFTANSTVAFFAVSGTVPGGITEGAIYHVVGVPTTNTFQVSTTASGGAVTLSSTAAFVVSNIAVETFASQGTLELGTASLDLIGLA